MKPQGPVARHSTVTTVKPKKRVRAKLAHEVRLSQWLDQLAIAIARDHSCIMQSGTIEKNLFSIPQYKRHLHPLLFTMLPRAAQIDFLPHQMSLALTGQQ
jgi:hypothetical protein